ncbi:enoyl-CoA hydratase/isomerase family protein [Brevibacillus marinus]|uniref:enoyl-CoA hydratase/isomerase family protein n=1 Tax=Brevibacillus marinus TaxID=2496837 RepID=UPI000F81C0F9|nr:enoyl-CoA hydratase-related protein [Brevibacillus marinus]
MGGCVRVESNQGVATVTIDNPPLNVLSARVVKELKESFSQLRDDQQVMVIVLTGAGEKAFMAGADIKEFPEWLGNMDMKEIVRKNHELFAQIERCPKPVIAMLNGMALGGGCELALACDLRIAEEHVRIGFPEIKLGIFPGGGGTQRLPRLIGASKALELMFLGEPITAEEALKIGLVNKVAPKGQGMEFTLQLARKIASYSLKALSAIKEAVRYGGDHPFEMGISHELELFYQIFQTEDAKEGIHAFIEKRTPTFQHK